MSPKERQPNYSTGDPLNPAVLPPELAEFLARQPTMVCLAHGTDQGTVYVLKAPKQEIESVRGTIPIQIHHELWTHPAAPVIRTLLFLHDRPRQPLTFETFTNIDDPQQRADFAAMASQEELLLLFYDEDLRHSLSKRVRNGPREAIVSLLNAADNLLADIPRKRLSFELAKRDIMEGTHLQL